MSCKGCAYAALLSGAWCCDYLSMTGHRRPCPPGEGCTVRKEGYLTKRGSAFMKRRGWDTEKAKALYDQKLSDAEIAGRVGTTASAVAFWRRGLGLPANQGQRPPSRPENPESKAASPPPVSPPLRTLALPSTKGPVEMLVEMDGHAFALRAPDLEGAERIYEYAGQLLKDMGQAAAKLKEETDDA
ncbi:hypothetical protein [uncultured Oscillibacter sp.]|uniref:hypothetical protein n=1 Tax=uncultured Oscillibacter sp. TaxID=876091 RepID=UPI002620A966|nr:hypothetical protein [uncultured Oscillibacter sp.]